MRCSSDVLKKTSPLDVFGDVSEKVKHLTNDASNDVSPPALGPKAILIFSENSSDLVPSPVPYLHSFPKGNVLRARDLRQSLIALCQFLAPQDLCQHRSFCSEHGFHSYCCATLVPATSSNLRCALQNIFYRR